MQATNIYFTKLIKLENRVREFNFRKLPNTVNNYHVDVTDDRGERFMFRMFPNAEQSWQLSTNELPQWVQYANNILGQLIENETATLAGPAF
jgi:hypothetical protein